MPELGLEVTEGCPKPGWRAPSIDLEKPRPELPPEIWHQIFERTVPPSTLVDCGAPRTEESFLSIVIQHKIVLMSVCWDWYNANKTHLYEHIDLKRPTQLFALQRSLESWPHNGHLVKHLHFRCIVKEETMAPFLDTLQEVVDLMPNLYGFSLSHDLLLAGRGARCCLPHFRHATLRELQVEWPLPLDSRGGPEPAHFSRLRSLSLQVNPIRGTLPAMLFPEDLHFPELKHLEMRSLSVTSVSTVASWKLPSLTRLSLAVRFNCSFPTEDPLEGSISLLSMHGRHLEELQVAFLSVETRRPHEAPENIDLAQLCPNLRHLVLYWRPWHTLSHPTIQWIDIWAPWFTSDAVTRTRWQALRHELIEEKSFPSLRRVRILDSQFASLGNIPFDLPPWSVRNQSDSYELNFLDFALRHEEGLLVGNGMGSEDYSSEDDSDYEYESGSEVSEEFLSDADVECP